MSSTDPSTRTLTPTPNPVRPGPGPRARMRWTRLVVVVGLLLGSVLARYGQDLRIRRHLQAGRAVVVPLEKVPANLGPWTSVETTIDPQIVRTTGADRVVTRRYTNRNTGVAVDVILLFGPAGNMAVHTPTLCYPIAGYRAIDGPSVRQVVLDRPGASAADAPPTVPFQAAVYARGEGPRAELQEVYWTWRYEDAWTPEVLKARYIERVPSMIKVHTARPVLVGERRDSKAETDARSLNPNEALLRLLVPEIERLLPPADHPPARG